MRFYCCYGIAIHLKQPIFAQIT